MFRIPDFYQMPEMTYETAKAVFNGDVLKGMEMISEHWDRYASGQSDDMYEDDDAFFEEWIYEVNAYNIVFEGMGKLFKEAA